jgi:DNA-binding MarR family transcriptional regulator
MLSLGFVNAAFFGLKRAHHGVLRFMRPLLTQLGLTAARFDLLYALPQRSGAPNDGMRQSALRRQLGVSRPTVSRMLASLEELGLVHRGVDRFDRRQVAVSLTQRGLEVIRRAKKIFIQGGLAQLAVDTALVPEPVGRQTSPRWHTRGRCLLARETLDGLLRGLRYTFGDSAKLCFPSHHDR